MPRRPRRLLSQGIRIYVHASDRELVERDNYNYATGMAEIDDMNWAPGYGIFAVGSEEGAMAVHYKLRS